MSRIAGMDFGKVRNTALLDGGRRILRTTDRISAFDAVLPFEIPGKGAILQALSLWFFRGTADIVRNHVVGPLSDTHLLVNSAQVFPVEFVVRGFLTGSLWRMYKEGGPEAIFANYGVRVPAGLGMGACFSTPLLTPTSKARLGHDEPITLAECQRLVPDFHKVHEVCLALFERGQKMASERGLVLVDTKYEMGLAHGELMLVDEIHTPDSSRYWRAEELGLEHPTALSKEFFREILVEMFGGVENIGLNFAEHSRFREAPFVAALSRRIGERYREVFHLLTGGATPEEVTGPLVSWPLSPAEFERWEKETRLPEHILVCGNGGRDATLATTFASQAEVRTLFYTPGDRSWGGKCQPLPVPEGESMESVVSAAKRYGVGLVLAGPELPIVQGVADICQREALPVLAPRVVCAALEWSKVFAKEVALEADLLTAAHRVMGWSEVQVAARESLAKNEWQGFGRQAPFVLKYDGLAAGKGVFLLRTLADLKTALEVLEGELPLWEQGMPNRTGEPLFLVEEMLQGDEMSVIALCHGREFRLLPFARDYKRRNDGQEGPNTGGMGAVCPVAVEADLHRQFCTIISRTLETMERRQLSYSGFLYAGCMIDSEHRAWVLEYNCRLGDPETQVMLPGLGRDFVTEVWRVAQGLPFWEPERSGTPFVHDGQSRVLVVAASPEYPVGGAPRRRVILPPTPEGGWASRGVLWAPAGVDAFDHTRAGRVLGVVGEGADMAQARRRAYGAIGKITLKNPDGSLVSPHYRHDVGGEFVEQER